MTSLSLLWIRSWKGVTRIVESYYFSNVWLCQVQHAQAKMLCPPRARSRRLSNGEQRHRCQPTRPSHPILIRPTTSSSPSSTAVPTVIPSYSLERLFGARPLSSSFFRCRACVVEKSPARCDSICKRSGSEDAPMARGRSCGDTGCARHRRAFFGAELTRQAVSTAEAGAASSIVLRPQFQNRDARLSPLIALPIPKSCMDDNLFGRRRGVWMGIGQVQAPIGSERRR